MDGDSTDTPQSSHDELIENHPRRKVLKRVEFTPGMREEAEARQDFDREIWTKPVPGREYFYEWFLNMRAPASGKLPSIEVFNAAGIRLANAAWDFGYRRIEDEQQLKWIPSAGMFGADLTGDEGTYLNRNEDGTWPSESPLDYIDPDDIVVVKDEEDRTRFRATHKKSGRAAYGKSRLKAHKALIDQLEELEDEADKLREAAANGDTEQG